MEIQLTKPLAVFDIEATGLNISKDRIVEIAILKIHPNGVQEQFTTRINPEMEMTQEVIDIHGISNEEAKKHPTLSEIAPQIIAFIGDADLAGYNSNKFDIPILAEELLRVGQKLDIASKKSIDVQNIFHKMEQRTLVAAYKFYCDSDLVNAHSAFADTIATWEVLESQLKRYPELKKDIDFLADFSKGGNMELLDFAGRLALNDKKEAVYNFGKHKGKTVKQIAKEEPGYYGWFISDSTDFPKYTKEKLKEVMEEIKKEAKNNETKPAETVDLSSKLDQLKNKFNA